MMRVQLQVNMMSACPGNFQRRHLIVSQRVHRNPPKWMSRRGSNRRSKRIKKWHRFAIKHSLQGGTSTHDGEHEFRPQKHAFSEGVIGGGLKVRESPTGL